MAPFAGWSMPLHYGSQIAEHHAVRRDVGMFDVSHMRVIDVAGGGATDFLRKVFAGDVARLETGHALYGVLLNDDAGIIDDAIVYRMDDGYRVVANASTSERVRSWLVRHTDDANAAALAPGSRHVGGARAPRAVACFRQETGFDADRLPRFAFAWARGKHGCPHRLHRRGRRGGTGAGKRCRKPLASSGQSRRHPGGTWRPRHPAPRGPVSTSTATTWTSQPHPPPSAWAGTVAWDEGDAPPRRFVGRDALERQRRPKQVLRGVVLEGRGVMREGFVVETENGEGIVTQRHLLADAGVQYCLVPPPTRSDRGLPGANTQPRRAGADRQAALPAARWRGMMQDNAR